MIDVSDTWFLHHGRFLRDGSDLRDQRLVKHGCLCLMRLVRREKILRLLELIDDGVMQRHGRHVRVRERGNLLCIGRVGRRLTQPALLRIGFECVGGRGIHGGHLLRCNCRRLLAWDHHRRWAPFLGQPRNIRRWHDGRAVSRARLRKWAVIDHRRRVRRDGLRRRQRVSGRRRSRGRCR